MTGFRDKRWAVWRMYLGIIALYITQWVVSKRGNPFFFSAHCMLSRQISSILHLHLYTTTFNCFAMSSDERIRKKINFRNPMLIIGFLMTVFYLVLGGMLLLDQTFLPGVSEDFRKVFAAMLLLYGSYRGWRVWADHF